jgi:hypothetical protein
MGTATNSALGGLIRHIVACHTQDKTAPLHIFPRIFEGFDMSGQSGAGEPLPFGQVFHSPFSCYHISIILPWTGSPKVRIVASYGRYTRPVEVF